jgi:hypothetical protein
MLRHAGLAAAIIMLVAPASAQNFVMPPRPGMPPDAQGEIRVGVSMSFFMAAPMNDVEAAAKAQQQARKVIYESAGRECDLLRAVIASECRLESININVNRNYGNQTPEGFNTSGSFAFRVKLK